MKGKRRKKEGKEKRIKDRDGKETRKEGRRE